jgi:hypothetical protein
VPCKDSITSNSVKSVIEKALEGLKVHSVHFDQSANEKVMGRRSALVRLAPLPLPWKQDTSDVVTPRPRLSENYTYAKSLHEGRSLVLWSPRIQHINTLLMPYLRAVLNPRRFTENVVQCSMKKVTL